MPGWDAAEDLLLDMAGMDLAGEGGQDVGRIEPMLAAFDGDDHLLVAGLRPFRDGAYRDALVELLALAVPLGADRIALSASGRVWSLADPIPPVSADGDLRQRAVVLTFADAHDRRRPRVRTVLHPFDPVADGFVWGRRRDLGAPGPGEISGAVTVALGPRGAELAAAHSDPADLRRQAERCERHGHRLWLGDEAARRILADILAESRHGRVTPPP